jgi:hypothetical protein
VETCPECKQPVSIVSQDEQMVYAAHLDQDGQHCPMSGERPVTMKDITD